MRGVLHFNENTEVFQNYHRRHHQKTIIAGWMDEPIEETPATFFSCLPHFSRHYILTNFSLTAFLNMFLYFLNCKMYLSKMQKYLSEWQRVFSLAAWSTKNHVSSKIHTFKCNFSPNNKFLVEFFSA